jgi:hypothetical protein
VKRHANSVYFPIPLPCEACTYMQIFPKTVSPGSMGAVLVTQNCAKNARLELLAAHADLATRRPEFSQFVESI